MITISTSYQAAVSNFVGAGAHLKGLKQNGNAGIANFKAIGPYSASKAAVHFLTQGLRAELQEDDVSVLGVYPGPVDTRMAAGMEMAKATPAEVAEAILNAYVQGEEDIFPDAFSLAMMDVFKQDRKALEKAFAA